MPVVVALLLSVACTSDGSSPDVNVASNVVTTELRLEEVGFSGTLFMPRDSSVRRPAVVAFGGSEGGLSTAGSAAEMAAAGVPALAVAYFKDKGLPDELRSIPLEYFVGALRWLAQRPGVDPARLVAWGSSRGSEAALLLGVHFPDLVHAVVALAPSNLVLSGVPPHVQEPGWTLNGTPIAFTNRFGPDPGSVPASLIPVERISGPVLFVCGGYDRIWDACPMAEAMVARRRDANAALRHVLLTYPDAGHAIAVLPEPMVDDEPFNLQGATEEANDAARADAWPKVLEFLRSL